MTYKKQIRLGMVGGGIDANIGEAHRFAARLDNRYNLLAGSLSSTPERSKASGQAIGLDPERIYDNFTVIKVIINSLDILELHHDGHIRFNVNSAGEFTFVAP